MVPSREQPLTAGVEAGVAKVTIYGKGLTAEELQALKGLVAKAGCAEGDIVSVDSLVPGVSDSNAICEDNSLEASLVQALGAAMRVIWVWPEDSEISELPLTIKKYCYSYVPWDAEKLAGVAADDDVTCFETPRGNPVPTIPTPRNICVEEMPADGNKKKGKRK
jgi:hypothetical protein